ncbi:MAG TPA: HlyD family efflux transporter periplasmic adaptor subunit [Paraburkholderia sp.]|jgi:hypothetical protein
MRESTDSEHQHGQAVPVLLVLLGLMKRAREAGTRAELGFMLVNDTRLLGEYRQAVLWREDGGLTALSGVIQPEANAPYGHWLERVCRQLHAQHPVKAVQIVASDLGAGEAAEWLDWFPPHALWLPLNQLGRPGAAPVRGALLLAGDALWSDTGCELLGEWAGAWQQAWCAREAPRTWSWQRMRQSLHEAWSMPADRPWWKRPRVRWLALAVAVVLFPVHLTVLAPGELVPAHPAVIRAPLDGVIDRVLVTPNAVVKAGQPLFDFDQAEIGARRDEAEQELNAAEAEYREASQQALSDSKSLAQLSLLQSRVEEKRASASYLENQWNRSRVLAPRAGIAMFDDPNDWIGRPVQTGERIMEIAGSDDKEVEAWLPLGEAINLKPGAEVRLYLAANPLSDVRARVRFVAYRAQLRPDGTYAYLVRATLAAASAERVGAKGTAKLYGRFVPLAYWVLRRPWAVIRQRIGL